MVDKLTPSFYKKEKIEINLDGVQKTVDVYSSAPFFSDGEDMIWYDANIGGIINKSLKIMFAVTNFRILLYNFEQSGGSSILLPTLDDVVVMNRSSVSDSVRTGTFVGGGRIKGFGGVHASYGKSWSKVIGDLVFMVNGQDVMRWGGIADPTGISQMIKSVLRELYPKVKPKRKVKTTVSARDDPLMILKKRFASGEITKEEYEDMKKALE